MMKVVDGSWTSLAVIAIAVALAGCQKEEGPAEHVGREIDKAVERVGQQIEKAGEMVQETAKK